MPSPSRTGAGSAGAAAPSSGLSLGTPPGPPDRIGGAVPAQQARRRPDRAAAPRRARPFPAPTLEERPHLTDEGPVVRLGALRSAIGALSVTGATSIVWESSDRTTGGATADGLQAGQPVVTSGRRPLVAYGDGAALVSLRHVRELRRALFIARGSDALRVRFHDGRTVTLDPPPTPEPGRDGTIVILSVLQIGGELELRRELFTRAGHDGDVHQTFGFRMTTRADADPTEG